MFSLINKNSLTQLKLNILILIVYCSIAAHCLLPVALFAFVVIVLL